VQAGCSRAVSTPCHPHAESNSPLLLLLLQAFVVGRLQDSKVEVRGLSAATLSGIIKALPAHEMDLLRGTMLHNTRRLFTTSLSGQRGKRASISSGGTRPPGSALPIVAAAAASVDAAAGAAAFAQQQGPVFLAEAQAVVQGLKAFVLSSPYDVPGWMPEVLMALVAAANSRNPLVRGQDIDR
jgi:proteasome activator subunit 4